MWFKRHDRKTDPAAPRPGRAPDRHDTLSPFGVQINALKPLIPWAS